MQADIAEEVILSTFSTENELNWITQILRAELAEPYSIFTYNYFLTNWPQLTIMAYHQQKPVGCIIGNLDVKKPKKAYIAMLVVVKQYRRHRVGRKLFDEFYKRVKGSVDRIVLETECINTAALNFYIKLGFFKTRKMKNYYLSGNEAYRLKLCIERPRFEEKTKIESTKGKQELVQ